MDMDNSKQYSLRWEKHACNLASEAGCFFQDESFLDCTLSAEGQFIQAHKIILSASSTYLSSLLKVSADKHPILIFNDLKFEQLKALVSFIYNGSVNVSESSIHGFLNAAQSLLIKGLSEGEAMDGHNPSDPRRLPELNDVKNLKRNCRGGWPLGVKPVVPEKRLRGGEVEEAANRLEEGVRGWKGEERVRVPDSYVVKSWRHNSMDDVNGRRQHKVLSDAPSGMFNKFRLNRSAVSEDNALVNTGPQEMPKPEIPPTAERVKIEDEPLDLIEPKQEIVEDEEEEEDTNSAAREERKVGTDSVAAMPVPLLMCKASLAEQEAAEANWLAAHPGGPLEHLEPQDLHCPTCTKRYKSRYALNRHFLYECGKARKSFSCDECGKKVTRQDTLQKHKLIHLVQHLKEKEGEIDTAETQRKDSG